MKKDEMMCGSCNKVIKSRNVKMHSKAKLHLENVEKKVNAMKQNYVQVSFKFAYNGCVYETLLTKLNIQYKLKKDHKWQCFIHVVTWC